MAYWTKFWGVGCGIFQDPEISLTCDIFRILLPERGKCALFRDLFFCCLKLLWDIFVLFLSTIGTNGMGLQVASNSGEECAEFSERRLTYENPK